MFTPTPPAGSAIERGFGAFIFAILLLAAPAWAQEERVQIVISPTDSVAVHVSEPLCASRVEKGQTLSFEVARNLELSGHVVIEKGAAVQGEVIEVERNGRGGKGGKLVVQLGEMVARDGARIALDPVSARLSRTGGNRGILAKVFTFWLVKGGDPCFTTSDEFNVVTKQAVSVRVPRN